MCGKDGVGVLNMWKNLREDFFLLKIVNIVKHN